MEIKILITVLFGIFVSCGTPRTVNGQQERNLPLLLSQVTESFQTNKCDSLNRELKKFYFSKEIFQFRDTLNSTLSYCQKYMNINKFEKKRGGDPCRLTYSIIYSILFSEQFNNMGNDERISSLFSIMKNRKSQNEIIGNEFDLLLYLFDLYQISEFIKLFDNGSENDKSLMLRIVNSSNIKTKQYYFLEKIKYSELSEKIKTEIKDYEKLNLKK